MGAWGFRGRPGNWVIGSLFSNAWSTGSSGEQDINLFTWQYFLNYNILGANGLYLTSAPIMTANWEAESGNQWTVPLGGGIGKIFRIGKQPVNAQASVYYNVETPEFGSGWQLRPVAGVVYVSQIRHKQGFRKMVRVRHNPSERGTQSQYMWDTTSANVTHNPNKNKHRPIS